MRTLNDMNRLVEIRAYKLRPGTRDAFHHAVEFSSVPMLRRWGTEVVAFGPSASESDEYFLIRSYADLRDLNDRQDAFYGSSEWRQGPRESIVSLIEHSLSTVLWMSPQSVDDLRHSNIHIAK